MESLGDILKRVTERNTLMSTNGDAATFRGSDPGGEVCPICRGAGWVSKTVPVGDPDFGQAFPCRCLEEEQPESRTAALRRYSNLGPLARISFAATKTEGPLPDAASGQRFQDAMTVAVQFAEDPKGWLVFTGPSGCGKTHLAVALANRCIERGETTFFIVAADLLDHLRATFSPDSLIGYDELFEQVKTVPLLILDDLGAENSTAWAEEKLYQLVVHRHEARLPTIITSAFSLDALEAAKPRLASRLVDSNVVEWVVVDAPNYRDQRRGGRSSPGPTGDRPPRAPRR
jgi:DNA replication protein DnaC